MRLRSTLRMLLATWLLCVFGAATAAASPYVREPAATTTQGGLGPAIIGALLTLMIGGFTLTTNESYTEAVTDKARSEPGRSFLVGLLALLVVLGAMVLGDATGILLLLSIPLLIAFVVVAIFGSVMGYLAIGCSFTNGWAGALLVAVIVAAFTAGVPVIGGLVGFVVGAIGVGAVLNHYRDGGGGSERVHRSSTGVPSGR